MMSCSQYRPLFVVTLNWGAPLYSFTLVNFCRRVLLACCLQVPKSVTTVEMSEYCKFV